MELCKGYLYRYIPLCELFQKLQSHDRRYGSLEGRTLSLYRVLRELKRSYRTMISDMDRSP